VGDTVAVGDEVGSIVGLTTTSFLQAPKTSRQTSELKIKENPRFFMMISSY
jgi:gas vesicle protein